MNEGLIDEWNKQFADCEDVTTHLGSYFSIPTECYISPANSYGFLNGGIDKVICKFYEEKGIDIQQTVWDIVASKFNGEVLVGQAFFVKLYDLNKPIPSLIIAPTMRVPMILKDSVNVYLAARAIFLKLKEYPDLKSVSICGLGTGIGRVPYDICAKQMKKAYDDFWLGKYKFPNTWGDAQDNHQLLYGDEIGDLQYKRMFDDDYK
jgi:O-acetyl-ADP-ribose deacetylase (regulator of RNase III)